MKLSIKPLAAAVSLALISVSAHAALIAPIQGTTVPGSTGLYLETWNATSGATELVNLSYAFTDIAATNQGNLNTASGPAWTTAANPAGSGTVSQLNFGTIANAGTAGFTNYSVVAAATAVQSGITSIEGAALTSGSNPSSVTISGLNTVINSIQTEIANWGSLTASGTFFDSNGSTTANAATGPALSGSWLNGGVSANGVGTAAAFYSILGNASFSTTVDGIAKRTTATTAYNGFWFLSSSGQLTYNIASAAAPVPLPAAVWLLGSGLLGLIGVGRRRSAAV
jgi:hypothetical protein